MRSTALLTDFAERFRSHPAILASFFGAAACQAGVGADQMPEGGAGGKDESAIGGETSEVGPDESDASGGGYDGSTDGGDGSDVASADCGAIAAPNAWASWVMPNPARSALPNPASYTVSDSGNQVSDNVTGLIWQRNVDSRSYEWEEAKHYCACLTVDGVAGWRLPSRIELVSISDWTTSNPSIDSNAFPSTPSENFWSSSVLTNGDPTLGWFVFFGSGFSSYRDMGYMNHARCVTTPPATAPPGRYAIANGTVYDTQTKLTWQQVISTSPYTWTDATTYCSALSLNGAGWRVPSIGELQTLVDESTNPSIDGTAFPMTASEYFWSSSAVVEDPSRAWTAFFANGSTYSFAMKTPRSVRCAR
jgi:hypothetical protein